MPLPQPGSAYALGVEFGLLYASMQNQDTAEIAQYICRENQDQVLLLASRLRWDVVEMKPWGTDWFWCQLRRNST